MTLYAVCNPTAGNGRAGRVAREIENRLREKNISCAFLYTEKPGQGASLAAKAREMGAETVLSIGGDGTALEVAQGLAGSQTALGVIPAGTGNDFAKALGSPRKPLDALEFILTHPALPTDAGEVNGRMFLNEIGTGFDVSVLDYAAKAKKYCRGLLPYLYGVVRTLFRFRAVPITYSVEGAAPVTVEAFVAAVGNGGVIGGGIPIAPKARPDDGLLDVVIVGKIPPRLLAPRLLGLMRGKVLSFPETRYVRAATVSFSAPGMRLNVDGEIWNEAGAQARVLPGRLLIHRAG